jgi:hypothetical protein
MEVHMSNHPWQRLGAASGIVYVVVILLPDLIQGGPPEEDTMTTAQAIAHACATASAAQLTDAIYPITHVLGYLFFLFFLGSLWSALQRAEGSNGWLSAAAFGGGLVSLTIRFSGATASAAAAQSACAGIEPQLWQVMNSISGAAYFTSFLPLAVLSAASAVLAIWFDALPRWLGWMSAIVAVALLVEGLTGTVYARATGLSFLLFMLWTLVTSIVMMRRVGQLPPTVSAELTFPVNETG